VLQLALKIVIALSEQNTGQVLYFENSRFRNEQLTALFLRSITLLSCVLLLQRNAKSSEQLHSIVRLRSDCVSIF